MKKNIEKNTNNYLVKEFILNPKKISILNKLLDNNKINFYKIKDYKESSYSTEHKMFLFFDVKIKRKDINESPILILINFNQKIYINKDEINLIEFIQKYLKHHAKCNIAIINFSDKYLIIKKVLFNNITTFVEVK